MNRIIHNSHFKKNVSLEEQKAQKEDRFLRGRLIASMIYEYFRVIGAHDGVLDFADSFSFNFRFRSGDVQDFDTRWDESTQNCFRIVRYGSSPKISLEESSEIEVDGGRSVLEYEILMPETRESRQERLFRVAGDQVPLKERMSVSGQQEKQCSRGDQRSFRKERHERAKPTPKPLHPLSYHHQEVEVRRERETQRQESVSEDQSTAVQRLLESYLH